MVLEILDIAGCVYGDDRGRFVMNWVTVCSREVFTKFSLPVCVLARINLMRLTAPAHACKNCIHSASRLSPSLELRFIISH
jgi:hypothetical protein